MSQDWEPCGCAEGCDDCGGLNRGQTYTIITSPENTVDYKIGYHHGASGREITIGQTENYKAGYVAGFLARMEGER